MNPPFSVVFLTTFIGMAQGCFLALFGEQLREQFSTAPASGNLLSYGAMIVLLLLIAGLAASFFHLGHPERAWRAATMWRTSWLSREVIALPIFMCVVLIYATLSFFPIFNPDVSFNLLAAKSSLIIGVAGGVSLLLILVCLGMVYLSIKILQQWRTHLLIVNFVLVSCVAGFVLAVGFYILLALVPTLRHVVDLDGVPIHWSLIVGLAGVFSLFLLFVCTSMIYACLKFLQQWHTPFTLANFILLGCSSGFMLATTLGAWLAPQTTHFFMTSTLILTVVAGIVRSASLLRNKRLVPKSTLQSAIGVKNPKIVQKSSGAMAPTFNRHQFKHGKTLLFIRSIKWIFLALVFVLPISLLSVQLFTQVDLTLMLVTLLIQYLGLIAERWYFFADANHPQNIYYQVIC